jgi:hypothetical protein
LGNTATLYLFKKKKKEKKERKGERGERKGRRGEGREKEAKVPELWRFSEEIYDITSRKIPGWKVPY